MCRASFSGASACPQCGYGGPSDDPAAILAARRAFKERTLAHAPHARVSLRDKLRPWGALALGLALFVFFVRTCMHGGLG